MSVLTQIVCDGTQCVCDPDEDLVRYATGLPVHVVRTKLKARGWKVGLPGGRDLCPTCKTQPEAER